MKIVVGSRLKRVVWRVVLTVVLGLVSLTAIAGSCDDSSDEEKTERREWESYQEWQREKIEEQMEWWEENREDPEPWGWEEDKFERELNEYEREHGPVGPPH